MDVIPIIHCGDEHEYRLKNFIPLNLTGMREDPASVRKRIYMGTGEWVFFSSIVGVRAFDAANTGLEKLSFRRVGSKRQRSGAVGPVPLGKQDDHQANVNHMGGGWIMIASGG
ncbi:hypothetical protein A3Q36_14765 [Geobacillus stearothermophilus]|nr:hypothetical protein A3Q36_14765 [Geobacillus stearothermophilus]